MQLKHVFQLYGQPSGPGLQAFLTNGFRKIHRKIHYHGWKTGWIFSFPAKIHLKIQAAGAFLRWKTEILAPQANAVLTPNHQKSCLDQGQLFNTFVLLTKYSNEEDRVEDSTYYDDEGAYDEDSGPLLLDIAFCSTVTLYFSRFADTSIRHKLSPSRLKSLNRCLDYRRSEYVLLCRVVTIV